MLHRNFEFLVLLLAPKCLVHAAPLGIAAPSDAAAPYIPPSHYGHLFPSDCPDPFDMLVPPTAMIEKLANINRKPEDINHRHCKTQAETDPAKNILYQAGALGATGLATIPAYYGAKNVLRVGNNLINGEIRNGVRMPRLYTPKAFAKLTPEQARQLKPEDLAKLKPKAAAKLLPETITEIPLESLGRIPDKSALKISDDAMNSLERALGTEGSSARQEFLELSSSGLTKLRPWLVNLFVKTAIKAAEK